MTQRRDYLVNRDWLRYCSITLTSFLSGQEFPPTWDFFSCQFGCLKSFSSVLSRFSAGTFALSLHCPQKQGPFSFSTSDRLIKTRNISCELEGFGLVWKGFGVGHFSLLSISLVGSNPREQVPEQQCPPCGASTFRAGAVLWGFC